MRYVAFIIVVCLCAIGCKEDVRDKFKDAPPKVDHKENLIQMQKQEIKTDSLLIEKLIEEKEWNMSSSGTGLRFELLEETDLEAVVSGSRVFLEYTMCNLKGDTLYSSDKSGYLDVTVDYSQAESGLHELLKKLNYGEACRGVIPFHLAHGFAGDDYKIPPFTSLVVQLKIVI